MCLPEEKLAEGVFEVILRPNYMVMLDHQVKDGWEVMPRHDV